MPLNYMQETKIKNTIYFLLIWIAFAQIGVSQNELSSKLKKSVKVYKFETHESYDTLSLNQLEKYCYSESIYNKQEQLIKYILYPRRKYQLPKFEYRITEHSYKNDTIFTTSKTNLGNFLGEYITIKSSDGEKAVYEKINGSLDFYGNFIKKNKVLETYYEIDKFGNRKVNNKIITIEPDELNSINYSFFKSKGKLNLTNVDTTSFSYRTYLEVDSLNMVEDYIYRTFNGNHLFLKKVTSHHFDGNVIQANFYDYKDFDWIKYAETKIERCCNNQQITEYSFDIINHKKSKRSVKLTKIEYFD